MKILVKKQGLKEEDQFIILDESFTFIDELNHRFDWNKDDDVVKLEDILISNYFGKKFNAIFISKSRIDNSPIFIIDTKQIDRENKISEILD